MTTGTSASGDGTSSGAEVSAVPLGRAGDGGRSSLVIVGRILLLLLAAAALASAFALARDRDRDRDQATSAATEVYVCPMHPEVTSKVPGDCPICRMALEPVKGAKPMQPAASSHHAVQPARRRVFVEQVRAPAWIAADGVVTAVVYKNDLVGLAAGEAARFFAATAPNQGLEVRLDDEPPSPWDASTSTIRFRFESRSDAAARPALVGWVQLAARSRDLLVVPSSSVLYAPEGAYVLVPSGDDGSAFTRRPVAIGRKLAGTTVIISGLRESEPIVVGDTFSMEAARRFAAVQERGTVMK